MDYSYYRTIGIYEKAGGRVNRNVKLASIPFYGYFQSEEPEI